MASEITIQWDASPSPVDGYNVYRGTAKGNESTVPYNTSLVTTNSFVDNAVFPGKVYSYAITAVAGGVESLESLDVLSVAVPFPPTPPAPPLGAAIPFEILAGSTITNTGATSVAGDVGVWPGTVITGFGAPAQISGVFHFGDFVAAAAQGALTAAYNSAASLPGGTTMLGDIGGSTLFPGVYTSASSLGITGTLVLDARGDQNATWVFQIGSTLTTATNNSSIVLVGGAQAQNVYWQVGSSATLGVGTSFVGTIMAQASITANTGASVNGRLLARTGAVTLGANEIDMLLGIHLVLLNRSTAYQIGDVTFDCASNTFQKVDIAGTSAASAPTFNPTIGATTVDGSVTFETLDPPVSGMMSLPPSPPNTPPSPPSAPTNLRITSEQTT